MTGPAATGPSLIGPALIGPPLTGPALTGPALIDSSSVADAGAFLARVLRLDPQALVRLRAGSVRAGSLWAGSLWAGSLWAMLPFGVLVTRGLRVTATIDATVRADELLSALNRLPLWILPGRHDAAWRWPLPSGAGRAIEALPAPAVLSISAAAAATVRAAEAGGVGGRPIGSRVLRDALLDHVPIVVATPDGDRVAVSQRLVQAITRMGFVPEGHARDVAESAGTVVVRVSGEWVGLAAVFGTAWYRAAGGPLSLRPLP